MASNPPVRLKWLEHFHPSWVNEDCETMATREGTAKLYERLLMNKEVLTLPQHILQLKGPVLPDFEQEAPSLEEQEHYLDALLNSQLSLARVVCSDSPFAAVLQKRLVVLQRIFQAISSKFHGGREQKVKEHQSRNGGERGENEERQQVVDRTPAGTSALIHIGVRTGLSLLFSLLKQNWTLQAKLMTTGSNLCQDVLCTAADVILSLPSLSLANESKLPPLGVESLNQVTQFLKSTSMPTSGADVSGRRVASELVLALASQRGSLRFLLEWVELALCVSAASRHESDSTEVEQPGKINHSFFLSMLGQIVKSAGGVERNISGQSNIQEDSQGLTSLYGAAVCLMEELCQLACDYARCCVSPDENKNNPMQDPACGTEGSEVFVWGSNSSHQLAMGSQMEKVLTPKLAVGFANAQVCEAGQYCSFVIYQDSSVAAVGKGSYGRLGLGDSNNQSTPKKVNYEGKKIKRVSSSKGSDGHTLALTADGEVYSWGDGDYGKLGHGNTATQKFPKLIAGPLSGKVVKCISAGYRHSAAVTEDGQLYTWGEGQYGRLGHGDSNSKHLPTLVKSITAVGQVACGSSYTLAVSQDGRTVWSFGGGDNGKLGHGDTTRVFKPKVIETFIGLYIRKVACGSQCSLALTSTGQID
ncbi:probable E3 ubiquitin-protein ligase HERC1 [Lingula anatina]|uniref:Probable E3 ubiquitin-protein ligase HERC1 n=1 Tax=Lingula anatina TaxID=7574 RepID=A0A1S3JZ42_LINAN|nr:probable E3 ubiquitin-protein ligase HERC1 [Lingula anatina]|eukprot:XP_013415675.1 probable E3 ubiquitin-protein ligase HERC1 [Lingula anatina]